VVIPPIVGAKVDPVASGGPVVAMIVGEMVDPVAGGIVGVVV
jgi:hypothetical protein